MGKSKKKSKSKAEQAKSQTRGASQNVGTGETWAEEVKHEEDRVASQKTEHEKVEQNKAKAISVETNEEDWDKELEQNEDRNVSQSTIQKEENFNEEVEQNRGEASVGRGRRVERDWNAEIDESTDRDTEDSRTVNKGYEKKSNSWGNSYNSNSGGSDYSKNRKANSFNTRKSEPSAKHDRRDERSDRRNTWNDNGSNRGWRDDSANRKNRYSRNNQQMDSDFNLYREEFRSHRGNIDYTKVEEITKNLFDMPEDCSLAHCVAEDFNMGSGIAVQFRRDFRRVDELLNQRQRTGGLAILQDKGRYIYYLVTKRVSSGKPTYDTLFSSLKKLREHVIEHDVEKIAMPRIGCGLDRLEWDNVKFMVEFLFRDVNIEIIVCNLEPTEDSPQQRHRNCKVTQTKGLLHDIETGTGVMYFSSEDGYVSEEMTKMDEKVPFLREFHTARKLLGNVILYTKSQDYLVCTCIVRKSKVDLFDFTALQKCISTIQRENKKLFYYYFAFQAFRESSDPSINEKIINILRNGFRDVEVYVCWPEDLENDMPRDRFSIGFSNNDKEQETKADNSKGPKYSWTSSGSTPKRSEPESKRNSRWDDKGSPSRKDVDPKDDSFRSDTSNQEFNMQANSDYWDKSNSEIGFDDCNKNCSFGSSFSQKETCYDSSWSEDEKQQSSSIPSGSQLNPETPSFKPRNEPQNSAPIQSDPNVTELKASDDKFKLFEDELALGKIVYSLLKEEQSLPALPKNCSRVCFAREDLIMESGIPAGPDISQKIGKLLGFNQKEGGLAVLKEENNYFYCLVISKPNAPPSPPIVFSAIEKLCDHAKKNFVKKLVIPKMDNVKNSTFDWKNVKYMFQFVFRKSNIDLIFAPYEPLYSESHLQQRNVNKLIHGKNAIHQVKKKSIIIYLASADGHFTQEMDGLTKKFDFAENFRKKKKSLGDVIRHKENEEHVVYGCIVKKEQNDNINFEILQKCIFEVNEENSKKEKLTLVGIQAVNSDNEGINFKIVTILLNTLKSVTIQMCWPGELRDRMPTNRK